MQKAYDVQFVSGGEVTRDTQIAESHEEIVARFAQYGLKLIEARLDWNSTLALATTRELDARELSQFYFTLGQRVGNGTPVVRAVRETADFTRNIAVKLVLNNMATAVERGQELPSAMRDAGLPRRDWSLVQALSRSGRSAEAFTGLGQDYKRRGAIKRELRSTIYGPIVFLTSIYCLSWAALVFIAPRIEGFFTKKLVDVKMPEVARIVYGFADVFNAHLVISTIIYLLIGAGIVAFAMSSYARRLIDLVPTFRALSERTDHAGLWAVFAMLYEAAVRRDESASMTAATASREDNRESFMYLASRLQAGRELSVAVREVGFPKWVSSAVGNALSVGDSSNTVAALEQFTDNLAMDVRILTERVTQLVRVSMFVVTGLALFGFAMIAFVPILEATLHAA